MNQAAPSVTQPELHKDPAAAPCGAVNSILSELQQCATSLVTSPELPALLSCLDQLPKLVATLRRAMDPDFLKNAPGRTKSSVRETLTNVQRALIYVESRLQHERSTLQSQLRELDAQREWAIASRQII